jgi:MYXO-CTERM domain-containing protein
VRWVGPSGHDAAGSGASKADPYATPQYALAQAQPGDEIRVLAGTYGAVDVESLHATEAHPVVIRADDPGQKPVIDGNMAGTAFGLNDTAYLVIDGFEIKNGGDDAGGNGVYLRASAHCTLRNSFIHDNGHNDVLFAKADEYSGGAVASGFHLIEDNEIADTAHGACSGGSNQACVGMTYYGIKGDNNAGAGNVIRRNKIHGHDDNTSPCGDEDSARELADGSPVLALVGGGGTWTNHDLEFYGNTIEDARDDGMELDGICVNARIWGNTIDTAQNAFSAAPVMPGPYFFVRNVATGSWGPSDAGFKMNTAGESNIPSRHVYVYHNTFVRSNQGALINLWFAVEGDHNVPIHDFVFKNNVFSDPMGGECTDAYNHGTEEPSFDGNVWWTTDTTKIFSWWNGATTDHYDTFAAYQAGTSQDAHGAFGEPGLDASFVPKKGALVIDRAVPIPGINDHFVGKGPDVGAFEFGASEGTGGSGAGAGTGGGPGAGGSSGAGKGSGGGDAGGGPGSGGGTSGGCGCRVAGDSSRGTFGATAFLALAALLAGARRRRPG